MYSCQKGIDDQLRLSDKTKACSKGAWFNGTFTNPLPSDGGDYQDPWVIRAGNYYYYLGSDGGRLYVYKSERLEDILTKERIYIFTPPAGTSYSQNLWAPEMHYLQGRWYVYFAADDGNNANHRMHVLAGGTNSSDPLAVPFVYKAKITPVTDRWAIDGTPFIFNNQLYFVWSGWPGTTNTVQYLYIAKMSNPYTLSTDRVEISRPEFSWETVGDPDVNEGPQVLVSGSTINIIYSASGSWTDDYCLGRLTCTNGNPMSKSSWTKVGPVFSKTSDVFGPGHACFVKSPDNIQWWIVYHANKSQGSSWHRNIRIQQFTWHGNVPYFGFPVSPNVPMACPTNGNYDPFVSGGVYKITAVCSNLCMDVPSGLQQQVDIQQWYDNGNNAQRFRFDYVGDGYYKITNIASGWCLDNPGGSLDPGTHLNQWPDNGNDAQLWRIEDMYFCYKIINKRSNLPLDVINGSLNAGEKIQMWYPNGSNAQLFRVERMW